MRQKKVGKKVKKEKRRSPRLSLLIPGIIIIIILSTLAFLLYDQNQDIRSNAEDDDPNFCQNHCKDPTCRGKPDFYDEECCLRIQQTGDPFECPWPQRGWCMPEHCATIPEGVSRLRCAGPRESWCNMCKERKCPGFVNSPLTPTIIVSPTTVFPIVTFPLVSPTIVVSSPTPFPTVYVLPTETLIYNPTQYLPSTIIPTTSNNGFSDSLVSLAPTATILPSPSPVKVFFPKILPSQEELNNFIQEVKQSLIKFFHNVLP